MSGAGASEGGLLGLLPGADAVTWSLPVTRELSNGGGFLWGGAGLGAAIEAMERGTGRRCVAATAQYLRPILPGGSLDLSVRIGQDGARVSQAQVTGSVDGETALVALGALTTERPPRAGTTLAGADLQWGASPAGVPAPEALPPAPDPWADRSPTVFDLLERRLVPEGLAAPGHRLLWARFGPASAGAGLAVVADLATLGLETVLGRPVTGASLDNAVRLARPTAAEAGDWVLLDVAVDSVVGRVVQLSARIYDRTGVLVALAGQSGTIRARRARRARPAGA